MCEHMSAQRRHMLTHTHMNASFSRWPEHGNLSGEKEEVRWGWMCAHGSLREVIWGFMFAHVHTHGDSSSRGQMQQFKLLIGFCVVSAAAGCVRVYWARQRHTKVLKLVESGEVKMTWRWASGKVTRVLVYPCNMTHSFAARSFAPSCLFNLKGSGALSKAFLSGLVFEFVSEHTETQTNESWNCCVPTNFC